MAQTLCAASQAGEILFSLELNSNPFCGHQTVARTLPALSPREKSTQLSFPFA